MQNPFTNYLPEAALEKVAARCSSIKRLDLTVNDIVSHPMFTSAQLFYLQQIQQQPTRQRQPSIYRGQTQLYL